MPWARLKLDQVLMLVTGSMLFCLGVRATVQVWPLWMFFVPALGVILAMDWVHAWLMQEPRHYARMKFVGEVKTVFLLLRAKYRESREE
jgi:hypothetical protein